jgi:hypothetical protein
VKSSLRGSYLRVLPHARGVDNRASRNGNLRTWSGSEGSSHKRTLPCAASFPGRSRRRG